MRIDSLAIKGVLAFQAPMTLDLRGLDEGLIAVVGANGEGKSTLLELPCAALFRQFPSRSDKELVDYATERDSYLEAVLTVDTRRYRARVNLDGVKRASDAILEEIGPDGNRRLLNDGKVTTYDAAVRERFPSLGLLLSSAFAAQNKKGSFVSLDKKGRKQLFAELLDLEPLQAMSDTARAAAGVVEQARGRLVAVRDLVARETGPDVTVFLEGLATALASDRVSTETRREVLRGQIDDLEARQALLGDPVAAYQAAAERVRTFETTLADRRTSRAAVDVRRTTADLTHVAESGKVTGRLTKALTEIDERLTNNRRLLDHKDAIAHAVARLAEVDGELDVVQTQQQERRRQRGHEGEARDRVQRDLHAAELATQLLARAKADRAILDTVPCGGAGEFAGCQFLTNAQTAAQQIADLTARAEHAELKVLALQIAERLLFLDRQLETDDRSITKLRKERESLQVTAKRQTDLASAEARIQELETKRTDVQADAERDRHAAAARLEAERVRLDGDQQILDTAIAELDDELEFARGELAAKTVDHQRVTELLEALTAARADWDTVTKTLARLEAQTEDLARRRSELAAKRTEVTNVEGRLRQLEDELLDWHLLTKALARDGLPTLEIALAGPTVSAIATDLLLASFSGRFSLELVTQEAKADGKGLKEVFELKVMDNTRGGDARDLSDLSGGEQVIVDEALKNALAIYLNQRTTTPVRTCWRDETIGALDAENAPRYVAMLRRVRDIGGFSQIYFVSHNAEAAALADAQIHVGNGQAIIMRPPFAQAA